MARTELDSVVAFTRNLLSDAAASTWDSTAPIVDALDAHRVFIDWTPLRHDRDYRVYEAKGRTTGALREAFAGVRDLDPVRLSMPDFGEWYSVGHFDSNWKLSDQPSETGNIQSPNAVNAVGATWTFSTPPNRELWLSGWAYNPWFAAADLLMETPDSGREVDTSRTRGQVSRTI